MFHKIRGEQRTRYTVQHLQQPAPVLSNMKDCQSFLLGAILLLPVVSVSAFYLPGAAPRNFEQGEQVDLFVNALTPMLSGKDDSKLVRYLDSLDDVILTRPYSTRNL